MNNFVIVVEQSVLTPEIRKVFDLEFRTSAAAYKELLDAFEASESQQSDSNQVAKKRKTKAEEKEAAPPLIYHEVQSLPLTIRWTRTSLEHLIQESSSPLPASFESVAIYMFPIDEFVRLAAQSKDGIDFTALGTFVLRCSAASSNPPSFIHSLTHSLNSSLLPSSSSSSSGAGTGCSKAQVRRLPQSLPAEEHRSSSSACWESKRSLRS
jgi:hypothetical protein